MSEEVTGIVAKITDLINDPNIVNATPRNTLIKLRSWIERTYKRKD